MRDKNLPLDWAMCFNGHFYPMPYDVIPMGGQSVYDACMKEYEHHEKVKYYCNVVVDYDTCDCGDGYGCSHGGFPTDVRFIDSAATIYIDGDDLEFNNGENSLYVSIKGITYAQFELCCQLLNIHLVHND